MLKLDARSTECFSVSRRKVAQSGTFIKMFSIYKRFFNVDSLCLRGFNPYLNEDSYLIMTRKVRKIQEEPNGGPRNVNVLSSIEVEHSINRNSSRNKKKTKYIETTAVANV